MGCDLVNGRATSGRLSPEWTLQGDLPTNQLHQFGNYVNEEQVFNAFKALYDLNFLMIVTLTNALSVRY